MSAAGPGGQSEGGAAHEAWAAVRESADMHSQNPTTSNRIKSPGQY